MVRDETIRGGKLWKRIWNVGVCNQGINLRVGVLEIRNVWVCYQGISCEYVLINGLAREFVNYWYAYANTEIGIYW